jgi:transcriptional regulator with XRE-family HTH domain
VTPTSPEDARREIGSVLRTERKRQGRSQTDVANAIGTDQGVISRAERGLTTIETQLRIGAELGLNDLVSAA